MNLHTRALIGFCAWITLNGTGLVLAINAHNFLKWIGYFDYLVTGIMFYTILYKFLETREEGLL